MRRSRQSMLCFISSIPLRVIRHIHMPYPQRLLPIEETVVASDLDVLDFGQISTAGVTSD